MIESDVLGLEFSTGRYLSPDPLARTPAVTTMAARVGGSSTAYAYADNNPISKADPTGLYSVNGCTNVPSFSAPNTSSEKSYVEEEARRVARKITNKDVRDVCADDELKNCVLRQIEAIEIVCNVNTGQRCREEPRTRAYTTAGRCNDPTNMTKWCDKKVSLECLAKLLVHEAAHACGWGGGAVEHPTGYNVPGEGTGSVPCG